VDWAKIADALEMACEIRNVSLRDVALEIGISPSGLTRLRQGQHLNADGLAALVAWLYPQRIPHWVRVVEP
jgi:transcriptional regulator with XRE-family HTH domain